jgi:hypothetical protein
MRTTKNQTKEKKGVRAYILSYAHGTIQIGDVVYHIPTREKFNAPRKGLKNFPSVIVSGNNWEGALEAVQKVQKGGQTWQ